MRITKPKFLLFSIVPLLLALIWHNQLTLNAQHREQLQTRIEELNNEYMETLDELDEATDEKNNLFHQLDEALDKIEDVEKRNEELEQILFNQRETYRVAIAGQGATMAALSRSSFTEKMYERAWARLGAHGLKGIGASLVSAEERYGVNSLIIAAIAYLESGGGRSMIAREKNNLFGLGAAGASPFASALSFSRKQESVYFVANLLRYSYLCRWGRHYRGGNLVAINVRYASDPFWANKVGRAMAKIACAAIPQGR